ncbi:hypothetical protein ACH5RR_000986 [Cinchona calisaya]|uniref:Uncharacterized protein n=1 Tax=Cinchona calisaya TaxID=153742 RepID=A0ABD3B2P3_9GENT
MRVEEGDGVVRFGMEGACDGGVGRKRRGLEQGGIERGGSESKKEGVKGGSGGARLQGEEGVAGRCRKEEKGVAEPMVVLVRGYKREEGRRCVG